MADRVVLDAENGVARYYPETDDDDDPIVKLEAKIAALIEAGDELAHAVCHLSSNDYDYERLDNWDKAKSNVPQDMKRKLTNEALEDEPLTPERDDEIFWRPWEG